MKWRGCNGFAGLFDAIFLAMAGGLGTLQRLNSAVVIARDGAVVTEIVAHGLGRCDLKNDGTGFIVWAELLKRHAAGTLSMFAFLVPITGIALSSLFFGEPVRLTLFVGGVLVLAGVYAVTRE